MSSLELQQILSGDAGLWLLVSLLVAMFFILAVVCFKAGNEA